MAQRLGKRDFSDHANKEMVEEQAAQKMVKLAQGDKTSRFWPKHESRYAEGDLTFV